MPDDIDILVTALALIDDDITRKGRRWPVTGVVVCPACGGDVTYKASGPRSMTATCDTCKFRAVS